MIVRARHSLSSVVAVLSMALATIALVAAPASAATASTTRSITASSPTSGVPGPPGSICAPTGTVSHYSVVPFQLDVVANDTVSIAISPTGFKAAAEIFEPSYLSSSPTANCLDDEATGASSGSTVTVSTSWGAIGSTPLTYDLELVVWGATSSDLGSYTATITTTGTNLSITPEATGDTTPPVVTVPSNITTEATSPAGAVVTYTASANDNVDGPITPTCSPASGSTFPLGTTTVSCSATDAANNTGTNSFTVTVQDTSPPVFSSVSNVSAEATSASGAVVTYTAPTATDVVDGVRPVTCLPASGSTFPLGSTAVACTASDASSNTATTGFIVDVVDTTGPVLTLPTVPATEATSAAGAVVSYTPPSATDAVDGPEAVTCDHAPGDTFALGSTTVHCSSTDLHANTSTGSFAVVVHDTTAPDIATISDVNAEATSAAGAVVTYTTPSATDAVDGTDAVSCSPLSGTTFPIGTTLVTCGSTDAAGNHATRTFQVIVGDTTAPVLVLPADVVAEATGPSGADVTYPAPSASDLVDGARPAVCTPGSGTTFALGHTSVSCTASDTSGNVAHGSFNVTVRDTTAPLVHVPTDVSVPATSHAGAPVAFTVTATDAVDTTDTVTCSSASGATFPVGTTTVACHATDAAGNTGEGSFTVTVAGIRDPQITAALSSSVPPGPTGWYRAPVTVTFTCTPGTAPVVACPAPVTVATQGSHTVSEAVVAADTGSAAVSVPVRIDTHAPSIRLRPAATAAGFTCQAHDALSGVESCTVSRGRGGRWTAVARDFAGNLARRTVRQAVGTAYFLDVPVQDGHALVRAGSSYQLRVYDPLGTPRYLNAARAGASPTAPTTPFRPIGHGWWVLGISIDPSMAGHDWVIGIKVGRHVRDVPLQVLP